MRIEGVDAGQDVGSLFTAVELEGHEGHRIRHHEQDQCHQGQRRGAIHLARANASQHRPAAYTESRFGVLRSTGSVWTRPQSGQCIVDPSTSGSRNFGGTLSPPKAARKTPPGPVGPQHRSSGEPQPEAPTMQPRPPLHWRRTRLHPGAWTNTARSLGASSHPGIARMAARLRARSEDRSPLRLHEERTPHRSPPGRTCLSEATSPGDGGGAPAGLRIPHPRRVATRGHPRPEPEVPTAQSPPRRRWHETRRAIPSRLRARPSAQGFPP